MNQEFKDLMDTLHPSLEKLLQMTPSKGRLPPIDMPKQGIYIFSDNGEPLYIGRSNNMRQRFSQHTNLGSQHNQAVFAFKIARKVTGNIDPAYSTGEGSRSSLAEDPEFKKEFLKAKKRVRNMEYRYIEVTDQKEQTLLEFYCAIALKCEYNDFDTH